MGEQGPQREDGPEVMTFGTQPPRRPWGRQPRPASGRGSMPTALVVLVAALAGAAVALGGVVGLAMVTQTSWTRCPNPVWQAVETVRLDVLVNTELRALADADLAELRRLLAPDFTHVTPEGVTWTREELLGWLESRDLDFQALRTRTPLQIRWNCASALVTYRSEIDVTVDGVPYRHDGRHTELWEHRNNRWYLVWAQITAIGGFPPARR